MSSAPSSQLTPNDDSFTKPATFNFHQCRFLQEAGVVFQLRDGDGNVIWPALAAIGKAPSINTFFTEVAEKIENKHQTDYNKTYDEDNSNASVVRVALY
jgi:predicted phage gp36 major capsid-like protein